MVSVIIPVYNVDSYIRRCLDSVLANTYKDFQIICVNDGSTDDTLNILMDYRDKDQRLEVISQKNQGVSAARNVGLEKAKGEYITFIDSDDWVEPQYLEFLVKAIEDTEALVVRCDFKDDYDTAYNPGFYGEKDLLVKKMSYKEIADNAIYRSRAAGALYQREAVKYCRFPLEVLLAEDAVFNLYAMKNTARYALVQLPLYHYFQRAGSAVHKHLIKDRLAAPQYIVDHAEDKRLSDKLPYASEQTVKWLIDIRLSKVVYEDEEETQRHIKKVWASYKHSSLYASLRIDKRIIYSTVFRFPELYKLLKRTG